MFVEITSAVKQTFGKGRITGSKKYKNCSGFLPSFSLLWTMMSFKTALGLLFLAMLAMVAESSWGNGIFTNFVHFYFARRWTKVFLPSTLLLKLTIVPSYEWYIWTSVTLNFQVAETLTVSTFPKCLIYGNYTTLKFSRQRGWPDLWRGCLSK